MCKIILWYYVLNYEKFNSWAVMVPKNIMKLYIDCYEALFELVNLKVLKKL